MVIMDGPVVSKGAIVSSEVSFGDALIDIKEVLTIYVGDAIFPSSQCISLARVLFQ